MCLKVLKAKQSDGEVRVSHYGLSLQKARMMRDESEFWDKEL